MNLRQAVDKVIKQNKSVGFTPTRFREMVANGDHLDLNNIISGPYDSYISLIVVSFI